jgi:retron-type reverse transcriptase
VTISNVLPNPSGGDAPAAVTPRALNHDETTTTQDLLQAVLAGDNLVQAWKRVKANKGAPGIDGVTIEDFPAHARAHWPALREQIEGGRYQPQAVRRVEIPKPDGGKRLLGIPTVTDRVIQQASPRCSHRSSIRRSRSRVSVFYRAATHTRPSGRCRRT